jgi:hypothetical protein
MAGNLGFNTYFVADGTATLDKVGYDGKRYPAIKLLIMSRRSLCGRLYTLIEKVTDPFIAILLFCFKKCYSIKEVG